jgi:hypothetical protein
MLENERSGMSSLSAQSGQYLEYYSFGSSGSQDYNISTTNQRVSSRLITTMVAQVRSSELRLDVLTLKEHVV